MERGEGEIPHLGTYLMFKDRKCFRRENVSDLSNPLPQTSYHETPGEGGR